MRKVWMMCAVVLLAVVNCEEVDPFGNAFKDWCSEKGGVWLNTVLGLVCMLDDGTYVHATDTNDDDHLQPKGQDGQPNTGDDEIWCSEGHGREGQIPCPPSVLSRAEAQALCEKYGGTWSEQGSVATCSSDEWNSVILWEDTNGDGGVQMDEYWCEEKDENGNPNGEEADCPFDGIPF